eukprot:368404-Pyramimonas_sp.AAC.1
MRPLVLCQVTRRGCADVENPRPALRSPRGKQARGRRCPARKRSRNAVRAPIGRGPRDADFPG